MAGHIDSREDTSEVNYMPKPPHDPSDDVPRETSDSAPSGVLVPTWPMNIQVFDSTSELRLQSKPQEPSPQISINRLIPSRLDEQRNAYQLLPLLPATAALPGRHQLHSQTPSFGVYRYNPLGAQQFRLVRVLPGGPNSKIKCEILHKPFEDPPSYVAVSYAWGDPSDTTTIQIKTNADYREYTTLSISKSLYYSFEALRERRREVLVWADALSIDQQNSKEKSEQLLLMADIYKKAKYVAVWLGPEEDDSQLAIAFLQDVVNEANAGVDPVKAKSFFSSRARDKSLPALATLFEREYWNRLWVVQEIFNAASIYVLCGPSKLPWWEYQNASLIFRRYKKDLEDIFPKSHSVASRRNYSYSQILAYSGPGSLPKLDSVAGLGNKALLEVLRMCRRKLSSDPRDKVFGVLGLLTEEIRRKFTVDYGKTVKDVYIDVVEFLLKKTGNLNVICESIHFPVHTSSANLPTWVPDWSHIPSASAISVSPGTAFAASRLQKARYKIPSQSRHLLEISAVPLGSISSHGVPVGTLCTLQDYLMAFLNWRALILGYLGSSLEAGKNSGTPAVQGDFCKTICFGQIPPDWKDKHWTSWTEVCFHVFASLIQERLPYLAIDEELTQYADMDVGVMPEAKRKFLQDHFGSRMMGRCFCLMSGGRMGLGTGFMAPSDEVVIPLGCSTPILLRPEGTHGEYRFVGDIYVHGRMDGKIMDDVDLNKRQLRQYVIH